MNKIKFSIKIVIIAIALILLSQVSAYAKEGTSTGTNLRIRKTASTDGEVLEVLALGDKVEIIEEQGEWYKISAKGVTGFVSKNFISVKDEGNTEQPSNNTQKEEQQVSEENSNKEENIPVEIVTTEPEANKTEENKVEENKVVENKVYKISENTKLYILPIVTSEIINEAKKDEQVTLINSAGLWAYIGINNNYGWIQLDKLSSEVVTNETPKAEEKPVTENKNENTNTTQQAYTPKDKYIKKSAVNIREQTNTNSNIVGVATLNQKVKVVGEEGNWYKVEWNGKSGYIRNDLVSDKKVEETSRSNNVDRTNQQSNATVSSVTNEEKVLTPTETKENTQQPAQSAQPAQSSSGVTGNDIVAYAKQFVGCRYVYGAAGPNSFDCSGLTMYVYKHFGYSLSHSSRVQATQGKKVTGELQPGDILVFTNGGKTVGHVGIYIGNDKFIHASDSKTGVIISNLSDKWNKSKYVGARRIL